MTFAWTTILVILLLLPGVAFLVGLWSSERHTREVVRTTAIGEIAVAIFIALVLHAAASWLLSLLGFNWQGLLRAFATYDSRPDPAIHIPLVRKWLPRTLGYVVVTALLGFGAGLLVARLIVLGPLRFLATHKWVYDVMKFGFGKRGVVTAFVMTKTSENDQTLMYKGRLSEFFVSPDGRISYVVLKNCTRYLMSFADNVPMTTEQAPIFAEKGGIAEPREWNYLMLDGENIANILFDKSADLDPTAAGREALRRQLDAMRHE